MDLFFENSRQERRLIGTPSTLNEANSLIHRFCEERGFKIHYIRMWSENGETIFDVGSHTEFFILDTVI